MAWQDEALRHLEELAGLKPVLFLLDFALPQMNGVELYDRLHAHQHMRALDLYDQLCHVTSEPPVPTLCLGKRRLHIKTKSGHRITCMETP